MKGMGDMGKLMKQAQQMQAKMAKAQEELEALEIEASSGGGAVTVRMNGKQVVLGISIKPEVVDPEDVEMLEEFMAGLKKQAESAGAGSDSKGAGK